MATILGEINYINYTYNYINYNIPFLNRESLTDNLYFCNLNVATPLITYFQRRAYIYSLTSNMQLSIEAIANGEPLVFPAYNGKAAYNLTDEDRLYFLTLVGNMVGLKYFVLQNTQGFILDIDKLDINRFSNAHDFAVISAKEYARCLQARFLKFNGIASVNNILNSVYLASQADFENIDVLYSGDTVTYTISSHDTARTQLFMEYIDEHGYNLWIKPTYGIVEFVYESL